MRRIDSVMDTRRQGSGVGGASRYGLDLTVLGCCSGSGFDRLDIGLFHYTQEAPTTPLRISLLKYSSLTIHPSDRSRFLDLLHNAPRMHSVHITLNQTLGRIFSNGISAFCDECKIAITTVDLIGTHLSGLPRYTSHSENGASTHPKDWNAILAENFGATVVSDFAIDEFGPSRFLTSPTAFVHRIFLRHPTKFRVCLKIDELVNLNFIPPFSDDGSRRMLSLDCGPGGLFVDYAMRYCTSNAQSNDNNGDFAARGSVRQDIVDRFLLTHDYLRRRPPFSVAHEMFGDHEAQRLIDECVHLDISDADTIATLTRITAANILKQYQRLLQLFYSPGQIVDELFICGPNAHNANIVDYLEAELPERVITRPLDDIGIRGDANEVVCYAHLALEVAIGHVTQAAADSHGGRPSSASSQNTTHNKVRGRILTGSRSDDLFGQLRQFSGGKPFTATENVRVADGLEHAIRGLEIQT